jgi:hypothetical protein
VREAAPPLPGGPKGQPTEGVPAHVLNAGWGAGWGTKKLGVPGAPSLKKPNLYLDFLEIISEVALGVNFFETFRFCCENLKMKSFVIFLQKRCVFGLHLHCRQHDLRLCRYGHVALARRL